MSMKIWELHGLNLGGAIRNTPDGEADVAGLLFSEKAYLLAIRDFRPQQPVALVQREGPQLAAEALIAHYGAEPSLQATGGRRLVATRGGMSPGPVVRRNDEVPELIGHAARR
ncbi:MAG: hypothetical protein HYX53_11190 [Chloroflexi bacterium]|nr:hypothetical protein [Chloroflexota bacterium]